MVQSAFSAYRSAYRSVPRQRFSVISAQKMIPVVRKAASTPFIPTGFI